MRYYEREHVDGYARIRADGLSQWSELHEAVEGYADFPNRAFVDRVLLPVESGDSPSVLEYGCGTGPAACFLAARGYDVTGIDLVPDAIEIARNQAAELGVEVRFEVEDVCEWSPVGDRYDIVLDSFCLQSIVLDADRDRVLDGVRGRLAPGGRYVLSSAVFEKDRDYGDSLYDERTGIEWAPVDSGSRESIRFGDVDYLPHRRHLTGGALRRELERHGFEIVEQSEIGGDIVAVIDA